MSKKQARTLLLIIFVAAVLLGGVWVYKNFFTFYSTSTTPSKDKVSVVSPYIDFNFNKAIDENQELEITDESLITRGYEIQDKRIRIPLDNLKLDQPYTITITKITATDNRTIENLTVEFTPQDIPFSQLSREQQDYILAKQDEKPYTISDPIIAELPHSTLSFELSAIVRETSGEDEEAGAHGQLVLVARLLLSAADMRINEAEAIKKYSEEVREYIRSLDLNPDDYTIEYVPVRQIM